MAIDPRMYERYSGRKGDPRDRLGAALAKSSERQSQVRAQKDKTYYERSMEARSKWWLIRVIASLFRA